MITHMIQEKRQMAITLEKIIFVILALISFLYWKVLNVGSYSLELYADRVGTDLVEAERLAQRFDVPMATILDLQRRNFTGGDIMRTLSIAKRAKQNVIDVAALREAGQSWDAIAARHRLNLAEIEAELGIAEGTKP